MRFLTVIVLNKLRLSLRKPPCAWPFPDRRAALVEADLLPLGQPVGRDALAGAMLTQLLQQQGLAAKNAPGKLSAGELLDLVESRMSARLASR